MGSMLAHATMSLMSENRHCVAAIAAVNCKLQAACGRFERCPGASCPFWTKDECLCGHKSEFLSRPHVAEHLLELRDELATVADDEARIRSQFNRLLNEEQESNCACGS
jgi:hypothetical protein